MTFSLQDLISVPDKPIKREQQQAKQNKTMDLFPLYPAL